MGWVVSPVSGIPVKNLGRVGGVAWRVGQGSEEACDKILVRFYHPFRL